MAAVHGYLTCFKLDNSAGTLVDLSQYMRSSGLKRIADMAEVGGYGTQPKSKIVGRTDANIPIGGVWDATLDIHMSGILGLTATQTFEWGPAGSVAGSVKYTGECRLASYDQDSPIDAEATWSGQLEVTGAVSRTTF
jgi:hypothetical protein